MAIHIYIHRNGRDCGCGGNNGRDDAGKIQRPEEMTSEELAHYNRPFSYKGCGKYYCRSEMAPPQAGNAQQFSQLCAISVENLNRCHSSTSTTS